MFLVDSAESSQNWDTVVGTIKTILERAEAEIVSINKWDERKLAYKVNGKIRGAYILCYFKAEGERLRNIEKDVQLSEQIMRVLILSAETREAESVEEAHDEMGTEADTLAPEAEKEQQKELEKEDLEIQYNAEELMESASAQQETGQTGEPEPPVEPAATDVTEPEQPAETTATDEIESEQLEQSETDKDF
jgi:small subunit ribosomal protein S6